MASGVDGLSRAAGLWRGPAAPRSPNGRMSDDPSGTLAGAVGGRYQLTSPSTTSPSTAASAPLRPPPGSVCVAAQLQDQENPQGPAGGSVVDVAAVVNVTDLDGAGGFVDGVDDPKLTPPGTETTGVLAMQRLPDPLRLLQQRASDELSGSQGNLFGRCSGGVAGPGEPSAPSAARRRARQGCSSPHRPCLAHRDRRVGHDRLAGSSQRGSRP